MADPFSGAHPAISTTTGWAPAGCFTGVPPAPVEILAAPDFTASFDFSMTLSAHTDDGGTWGIMGLEPDNTNYPNCIQNTSLPPGPPGVALASDKHRTDFIIPEFVAGPAPVGGSGNGGTALEQFQAFLLTLPAPVGYNFAYTFTSTATGTANTPSQGGETGGTSGLWDCAAFTSMDSDASGGYQPHYTVGSDFAHTMDGDTQVWCVAFNVLLIDLTLHGITLAEIPTWLAGNSPHIEGAFSDPATIAESYGAEPSSYNNTFTLSGPGLFEHDYGFVQTTPSGTMIGGDSIPPDRATHSWALVVEAIPMCNIRFGATLVGTVTLAGTPVVDDSGPTTSTYCTVEGAFDPPTVSAEDPEPGATSTFEP